MIFLDICDIHIDNAINIETKLQEIFYMAYFHIIKSYVTKQNFISRNSLELMWNSDNRNANIYTDAEIIIKRDDEHLFQVDLLVDVTALDAVSKRNIFEIHIIITSIVFIDKESCSSETDKLLMVDVPQSVFCKVQNIVKQITENAGYTPLDIEQMNFEQKYRRSVYK